MRLIMNTLFLKSGTHRVGMTLDVKEMAKVVKSLRSVRNDDSNGMKLKLLGLRWKKFFLLLV